MTDSPVPNGGSVTKLEAAPSKVDEVARALCWAHYRDRFPVATDEHIRTNVDTNWHRFVSDARTAIEAMRKPTTSMLFFGSQAMVGQPVMGPDKVRTLEIGYQAMIEEALQ